jgi:hypothetical protein
MRRCRSIVVLVLVLGMPLLSACGSSADAPVPAQTGGATLPASAGLAPELAGIADWFNAEPLTLAALRGQPVLLVFWSDT